MVGDILQPTHLLFILVVALLVLGPKRLPEVGRMLGNGIRDFREAINGESSHREQVADQFRAPEAPAPAPEPVAHVAPAPVAEAGRPAASSGEQPAVEADPEPAASRAEPIA